MDWRTERSAPVSLTIAEAAKAQIVQIFHFVHLSLNLKAVIPDCRDVLKGRRGLKASQVCSKRP